MKVLLVTPKSSLESGNGIDVQRIALGIEKHGVTAHVTVPDHDILPFSPDVIHIFNAYRCRKMIHCDRPVVTTITGTDINIKSEEKYHELEEVFQKSSAITFLSYSTYRIALQEFSQYRNKFHIVARDCEALQSSTFSFREKYRISSDSFVCSVIGGIRPIKNQLSLIRPFLELRKRYPKIVLAYLGTILDWKYGNQFLREAALHYDWIKYQGYIERDDIKSIYDESDVIINCSHSEGLSNVLLEALLRGKSIIASDIPGNRDFIDHGINGLLYPIDDDSALISNTELFLKRGSSCLSGSLLQEHTKMRFCNVHEAEEYCSLYQKAM